MQLRRTTLAETAVILLLIILLASMYALRLQQSRAEVMVLSRIVDNASVMSQFARTAEAQYAATIRSVVQDGAVDLTTDNETNGASLHFPATFNRILTRRFSEVHPDARFGVFSDDPFETQRNRTLDGFLVDALAELRRGTAQEYWRVENGPIDGFRVRYATPITMREECVACHNRPDWGLKNQSWKVGDVRGVWEVSLDVPKTDLQSSSEFDTLVALQLAGCLMGALLVFPAVRREIAQRSYFESLSINLNELAETDSLSGLANRRAFDRALDKVFSDSTKSPDTYGLIILDIDHFKKITTFNKIQSHIGCVIFFKDLVNTDDIRMIKLTGDFGFADEPFESDSALFVFKDAATQNFERYRGFGIGVWPQIPDAVRLRHDGNLISGFHVPCDISRLDAPRNIGIPLASRHTLQIAV